MSKSATPQGIEQAAVRRLVYGMAELDGTDAGEMQMMDAARAGLKNVTELQARLVELEETVEELEERAPDPSQKGYDSMDRTDKATVVCSKLRKEAVSTNGKSFVTYNDVVRMFDGRPSPGHAYDIMDTAAERDGYVLGKNEQGTKRLTFNTNRVNSENDLSRCE